MVVSACLQKFHGKVNAIRFSVWDLEVPRPCRAGADDNSIILSTQLGRININADIGVGNEGLGRDLQHITRMS